MKVLATIFTFAIVMDAMTQINNAGLSFLFLLALISFSAVDLYYYIKQ